MKKRSAWGREALEELFAKAGADPELATATIGSVVLELLRDGEEVSLPAIKARLQAAADEKETGSIASAPMAQGALKVISSLAS